MSGHHRPKPRKRDPSEQVHTGERVAIPGRCKLRTGAGAGSHLLFGFGPAILFRKRGPAQALVPTGIQMMKGPELLSPARQAAKVSLLLRGQRGGGWVGVGTIRGPGFLN